MPSSGQHLMMGEENYSHTQACLCLSTGYGGSPTRDYNMLVIQKINCRLGRPEGSLFFCFLFPYQAKAWGFVVVQPQSMKQEIHQPLRIFKCGASKKPPFPRNKLGLSDSPGSCPNSLLTKSEETQIPSEPCLL